MEKRTSRVIEVEAACARLASYINALAGEYLLNPIDVIYLLINATQNWMKYARPPSGE